MRWIVQTNLTRDEYAKDIKAACKELGLGYVPVIDVPFSTDAPEHDGIYYGSTGFVQKAWEAGKGVFHNSNFSVSAMVKNLDRDLLLNPDPLTVLIEELGDDPADEETYVAMKAALDGVAEDDHFFVRPDADTKEFAGTVMSRDQLYKWAETICHCNTTIDPSIWITISKPWKITKEWRVFLVEGRCVGGSMYKQNGRLRQLRLGRGDVEDFAESVAKEWTPHPVCVLDVCICGGQFYCVEFNTMNSSGFYHANVYRIVEAVTEWYGGRR